MPKPKQIPASSQQKTLTKQAEQTTEHLHDLIKQNKKSNEDYKKILAQLGAKLEKSTLEADIPAPAPGSQKKTKSLRKPEIRTATASPSKPRHTIQNPN